MDGDLVCCNDVNGFAGRSSAQYAPDQWRLFIDSSKLSLKAVLLHNGNKLSSIPLAHAGHMKEHYASIQGYLEKICYEDHQWNICADPKFVTLLTGLHGIYTRVCCFLCEWGSRARDRHYYVK